MKIITVMLLWILAGFITEKGKAADSYAGHSGSAEHSSNSGTIPDTIPDTLTVEMAYTLALERYPLGDQTNIQQSIRDLRVRNADAGRLPELRLSGLAQYQSEGIEISFDQPGMPPGFEAPAQPKSRYQIALDLEQPIYDGGRTRTRRVLEESRSERLLQEIQVEQQNLKNRINDAWFAIITLRMQQQLLGVTYADLDERLASLQSRIAHGAVPESAADIIRSEQLRITQQKRTLVAGERAALGMLSQLLDMEVPETVILMMPGVPDLVPEPDFTSRSEMALFSAHRQELSRQEEMVSASYRPRVSAFGQAAYGRPGLNMFEDEFQPWFIVGIRASWSLWNWRTSDRERQEIRLRHRLVDNQQEIFNRTMHMAVQSDLEKIAELRDVIRTDREIIELHERIVRDAASRLDNGAITATEYISELNNQRRAVINREMHHIQLASAWQNYITAMGVQEQ